MQIQKTHLTYAVIALTVASFLTAYFVKPHAPTQDIVTLDYDGKPPVFEAMPLANRVAKSYNLALILTRSAFTPSNATGLEALRNWASKKFSHDSNFLHPASLEDEPESNQSIIESYTHSLAASVRFAFEEVVANFLSWRIQDFQNSDSYNSFLVDYYGLFGNDTQAQELLAKYESARARDAIDPILIAIVWTILTGCAFFYLVQRRNLPLAQRVQTVLSTGWLTLAFFGCGFGSITWSVVSAIAPEHLIGLTGGVFNFIGNLSAVVVPLAIGFLVRGNDFTLPLIGVSGLALLGALSYIFLVGEIERVS